MSDELENLILPYLEKLGIQNYSNLVLESDFTQLEDGKLTKLDLGLSKISTLPVDAFKQFPDLEMLNLSGMELTELPKNIFKPLKKLRILGLRGNKLKNIDKSYFSSNPELKLVNLEGNEVEQFSISGVKLVF